MLDRICTRCGYKPMPHEDCPPRQVGMTATVTQQARSGKILGQGTGTSWVPGCPVPDCDGLIKENERT